jgi:clan AA aspartic protease
MGLTYSQLKLTHFFTKKSITVSALVDTGSMQLCIPAQLAADLGFDPSEVETIWATVADGRRVEVPRVAPIQIDFGNRSCVIQALVMGSEPLLGVIPIEAMDCIVDPTSQELRVNPAHPDHAVFRV